METDFLAAETARTAGLGTAYKGNGEGREGELELVFPDGGGRASTGSRGDKGQDNATKLALLEKAMPGEKDMDYYMKYIDTVVQAGGRYFFIKKPAIKTRLCHPDEGPGADTFYDDARTWEYFRAVNINYSGLQKCLDRLAEGGLDVYVAYKGSSVYGFCRPCQLQEWGVSGEPMDDETRIVLARAYARAKARFERRLSAWWKRYGPEKLTVWTYWADR